MKVHPLIRFMARVEKSPEGCWLWTGTVPKYGYGRFSLSRNKSVEAHRAGWLMLRGPIPPGLELDHLCRVRHCVNPDHLEPVTHQENIRRAYTVCRSGRHDLTQPGARVQVGRGCRLCRNEKRREWWLRNREGVAA